MFWLLGIFFQHHQFAKTKKNALNASVTKTAFFTENSFTGKVSLTSNYTAYGANCIRRQHCTLSGVDQCL